MSDNFNVTATLNNDGTISCTWSIATSLNYAESLIHDYIEKYHFDRFDRS